MRLSVVRDVARDSQYGCGCNHVTQVNVVGAIGAAFGGEC